MGRSELLRKVGLAHAHLPFSNVAQVGAEGGESGFGHGISLARGPTDIHRALVRAVFASTDSLHLDGTSIASGSAGTENLSGVRLAANAGGTADFGHLQIAFVGLKDGTLTAQERSDLLAWSQSHYGTP